MLDNLIEIAKLGENKYVLNNLLNMQKILLQNPNNFLAGEKLRKLLL